MRFLDCFAGIGGLSLGFERAGLTCAGHVEIEPFPRAVLEKHWPGLFLHDDIRTLTGERIRRECGKIDVVAGGPPCQPASTAGKRKGADDDRWLWPEFCRIVRETGCSWFVAENPRGFLSLPDAAGVLGELAGAGFEMRALLVGAHHVGAPHRRDRVFIIGRLADAERDGRRAGSGVPGDKGREGIGRGEPSGGGAVADAQGPRREGLQPAGRTPAGGCSGEHGGVRWPARPGEPQHEWEEPRLLRVADAVSTPIREAATGGAGDARGIAATGAGEGGGGGGGVGTIEREVGTSVAGVPLRLVRLGLDHGSTTDIVEESARAVLWAMLREVQQHGSPERSPQEPRSGGQSARECGNALPLMPQQGACGRESRRTTSEASDKAAMLRMRQAIEGAGSLLEAPVEALQTWRSLSLSQRASLRQVVERDIIRAMRRQNRNALRAAGNAIVPQVAEVIGRAIMRTEAAP